VFKIWKDPILEDESNHVLQQVDITLHGHYIIWLLLTV